jgi:hypothetical protein
LTQIARSSSSESQGVKEQPTSSDRKNCPADAFLSLLRELHNGPNAGKYLGDSVVESAASDIE